MLCAVAAEDVNGGDLMEQAIESSHGELIGWWSHKTISVFCRATGQWDFLAQAIADSRAEAEQDAKKWCAVVTEVTLAIRAVQREVSA